MAKIIKKFMLVVFVFAITLIGGLHTASADLDPAVNPFSGACPSGWPPIGSYELPIVAALTAVDYITTDYVSVLPLPIPGPGLINAVLIDFEAIANNLIIARSINWVLVIPIPISGPRNVHVRDAAIAQALQIAEGLERKIDMAFGEYTNVEELQNFRQNLEDWISVLPLPIP